MNQDHSKHTPQLEVGLHGWDHAHWCGGFYPEDMPKEWRFSYYSNEFRSVLLPWSFLSQASPETVQEWLDDSDESFEFYAEAPQAPQWGAFLYLAAELRPQLAGVVLPQSSNGLDVSDSLGADVVLYQRVSSDGLESQNALQKLPQYTYGCYCYHDSLQGNVCRTDKVLVNVKDSRITEPRDVRVIVDACLALPADRVVLIFSGEAPSLNAARHAQVIYELSAS
ncbi:MAG: DUF72 domain-containing protein [Gammaproteobacteria bacterium]|nr:DUF72 domain-containing protein [Gammaproteobacteria bacterium]MDH5799873.1 DUF72 domain-containing protein [Gammaproteobacteria bacterium]